MTINYNVTGAKRKRLAQALGEFVHSEPVYQNAPSYAYAVGNYTIDKDGVVTAPEDAPETEDAVIAALSEHGFKPTLADKPVEDRPTKVPKAKAPKKGRKAADVAPGPEADNHPEDAPEGPTEAPETPDVADGSEPGDQPAETPGEAPAVPEETPPEAPAKDNDSGVIMTPVGDNRLTISIPRKSISDLALQRLMQLLENKEPLFKRALKADELPVIVKDDTVSFPWFTLRGENGEAAAYGQFIEALCRMAKEQTRILVKPYTEGNDRFAMRIFMVRMGMKGPQYALIRKLMMGDLTGNSGWRFGGPPKKGLEDIPDTTEAPADEAKEAAEPEDAPQTADTAEADSLEPEATEAPADEEAAEPENEAQTVDAAEADSLEPEATEAPADEAGMPPDDIRAITIIKATGRKKGRKTARTAPEQPEAEPEDAPQTADAAEADTPEPEAAEADTTEVDAKEPEAPVPDTGLDAPTDNAADTPPEPMDSEEAGPTAESEVQHEQLSEQKSVINQRNVPMYKVVDSHEAIIPQEDFDAVQKLLQQNCSRQHLAKQDRPHLFAGLIKCSQCGSSYTHQTSGKGKYKHPIWICRRKYELGKTACSALAIPERILIEKTKEVLGLGADDALDRGLLLSRVREIAVPEPHQLIFCFKDDSVSLIRWDHKSRRESWTPEMREAARQKTLEKNKERGK